MKADLVLKNGSIYTVDPDRSWAQAIAISRGKIVYVGSDDGVKATIDAGTNVVDLAGKMVLPGFVDAHAHPSYAMDFVGNINLYYSDSLEEYQQVIAEYAQANADHFHR
jgi:predicted amidohydrolase YtcJ